MAKYSLYSLFLLLRGLQIMVRKHTFFSSFFLRFSFVVPRDTGSINYAHNILDGTAKRLSAFQEILNLTGSI
jgi:hypothetical protein